MRYLVFVAVLGFVVFMGCDDGPVEPREVGPYEVTTLRTVPEDTEVTFIDEQIGLPRSDLNENGQALWKEGEQAVLWDNGTIHEVPGGRFLGPSGEVLGLHSVWIDGQLTELPGLAEGIHEDGTIYLSRNDTLFTWRGGTLTATDRPVGYVGPEGRIWDSRPDPDFDQVEEGRECGYHLDGSWHPVFSWYHCGVMLAEEGGWALIYLFGHTVPGNYVLDPNGEVYFDFYDYEAVHVNSSGTAIFENQLVVDLPERDSTDLKEVFEESLTLGAINDDGEILAQLDNEVVLLTPR